MGLFRTTKGLAGRLIDVRVDKWLGYEQIKDTTVRMRSILTTVMVPARPRFSETFEEAMIRLNLTEADLQKRQHEFTRLLIFFVGLATVVLGYALYLAFAGSFLPSLITFGLAFYCLTQAFRFHFWLFQIKNKKLGCTFKEWFHSQLEKSDENAIIISNEVFEQE
jgi:intracellular multiplication protein IcmV